MDRLLKRSLYRCVVMFVVFIFFLNIILISHVVDLQILVQNLIYEAEWSSRLLPLSNNSDNKVDDLYECNITDEAAVTTLDRMQTKHCRAIARQILCYNNTQKSFVLENTCPNLDFSKKGTLIGCFFDSKSSRTLSGHHYKFIKTNSPEYCVNACFRASYKYAGVEYQNECHCGDHLSNATELPLKACKKYLCPSNLEVSCGGYEAISVYSTGIIEKAPITVHLMPTWKNETSDVKLLFLLQLNGRNIRQILRLLRIIFSAKHQYLIHVDVRQEYLFREMLTVEERIYALGFRNFHVLRNRYATIWGASNLLTMVLESVKTAFYSLGWDNWDFLLNLSESDFPILSISELESHLARNKDLNFLSSHGQDTGRFIQKQGLDFIFLQCENRMWRLGKRATFPLNIRIDGGSDWVVLSRNFLNFSISDRELPKILRETFATVLLPVESFFHTLASNSRFCNRIAKGNLKIANWKRKQGCRCAMLRSIVDWCGCSPLALTMKDASKFSEKAATKKPAFFARKFEGLVSETAIAIAERRALVDRKHLIQTEDGSLMRTWVNYYSASVDSSPFLNAWGRAIYEILSKRRVNLATCKYSNLSTLSAYKASDHSPIKAIAELRLNCLNGEHTTVQLLINNRKRLAFNSSLVVDGFTLIDIRIGSNADLKEDILRNYISPLSERDEVVAQLWWRNSNASSGDITSPHVRIIFQSSRGKEVTLELKPYNSIHGAQYATLPSTETAADEWHLEVRTSADGSTVPIASSSFVIFPSRAQLLSRRLVAKEFEIVDICSEGSFGVLQQCALVSWSLNSPDPKSTFPVQLSYS